METLPITVTNATVKLPTNKLMDWWFEGQALKAYAEQRTLVTDIDLKPITDDQAIIASLKKDIDTLRKSLTDPLEQEKKAIIAAFRDIAEPLNQADTINRNKLTAYRVEQERQANEARKAEAIKTAVAMQAGEVLESAPEIPAVVQHVSTGMGSVGFIKHYAFEIVDASLLPREYLQPDEKKIRAAVNAELAIPGVRVWRDDRTRVTTK